MNTVLLVFLLFYREENWLLSSLLYRSQSIRFGHWLTEPSPEPNRSRASGRLQRNARRSSLPGHPLAGHLLGNKVNGNDGRQETRCREKWRTDGSTSPAGWALSREAICLDLGSRDDRVARTLLSLDGVSRANLSIVPRAISPPTGPSPPGFSVDNLFSRTSRPNEKTGQSRSSGLFLQVIFGCLRF